MPGQRRERFPLAPVLAIVAGFALFAGLTVVYVSWSIAASNHRWCDTISLLNEAPAPSGDPRANPARAYEQKLAADFRALEGRLGC